MSELAARLRAALVGDYTGDVMEWDELKPEIRERWQRVADVARLRVPFSDAQIDAMADAFWKDYRCGTDSDRCIRAALAAGGLEPCAVPDYDPADVALMPSGHVLRDRLVEAERKVENQRAELKRLNAHLAKRPEGLPTMRDLREIGVHAYLSHDSAKRENAGCMVDPMGAAADAILTALRPWLRDPVGCELDVTVEEGWKAYDTYDPGGVPAVLDLCRSRISHVYECKECAARAGEMMHPQPEIRCAGCVEWERKYRDMNRWHDDLDAKLCAVRAVLEDE